VTEEIPKQELLIKLLKMSTSPQDGEALTAIRKANDLLRSAGWDWEKPVQGKIKVIGDPFKNIQEPVKPANAPPPPMAYPKPPPPPQGRPVHPQPRPAAPPPPPPKPFEPFSHRSTNGQDNAYPGRCWCCGHSVDAKAGKLFIPSDFTSSVTAAYRSKKAVICTSCDKDKYTHIGTRPAPQPKGYVNAPGLSDL